MAQEAAERGLLVIAFWTGKLYIIPLFLEIIHGWQFTVYVLVTRLVGKLENNWINFLEGDMRQAGYDHGLLRRTGWSPALCTWGDGLFSSTRPGC